MTSSFNDIPGFEGFDGVPPNEQDKPVSFNDIPGFEGFEGMEDKTVLEKEVETGSFMHDTMMSSRMIIDGMTLGWGDEAGAAVAAGMVQLSGNSDKPFSEVYREIKDNLSAEEDKFREENPALAIGLNIAGGLATGGLGATKMVGQQVGKAAIGGAVAGAGTAKEGDTLKGAAIGTLFGAGTGSLLKGGGWLWNKGTQRNIVQDLGKGDKFISLNLAADSANVKEANIGNFYKTVVGSSFGGGARLKAQEARILNPIASRLTNAKAALQKSSDNAKVAVKQVKANMARAKAEKLDVIKELKSDAKFAGAGEQSLVKESFKGTKDQALMNATKQIDEAVGSAERAFRGQAILKSIPDGQADDVIDDILSSKTPNIAMQKLDDLWVRDGFKMLKERKFQINANAVGAEIRAKLKNDFAAMDKASFQKLTDDVTTFLGERTQKGWIDGEDLSAIRSRLGMLANAKTDAGGIAATEQAIFKTMQDVLNRKVKGQLSGKALSSFEAHTSQWKSLSTLRGAVNSASKRAGAQGEFSADDWVSSIAKQSSRDARQGGGVLRAEADNVAILGKQRDKAITETAELVISKAEKQKMSALTSSINKTNAEIKKLTNDASKIRDQSGETAALAKARNANEIAVRKQEVEELAGQVKVIKDASSPENPGIFSRLAATFALGAGNLVTGAAIGGGSSAQGVQRMVAGQTAAQQVLNTFGKKVGDPLLQAGSRLAGAASNPDFVSNRQIPIRNDR